MIATKIFIAIVETISTRPVSIDLDVCSFYTVENMGRGKTESEISTVGIQTIRRNSFINSSTIQEREASFDVFPKWMADDHSSELSSIRKGLADDFNRSESKEGA